MTHEECREKVEEYRQEVYRLYSACHRYAQSNLSASGAVRDAKGMSSAYKGVCWKGSKGKWHAYFYGGGKGRQKFLGYFDLEADAARAFDRAARELYGTDCYLNFPDEG